MRRVEATSPPLSTPFAGRGKRWGCAALLAKVSIIAIASVATSSLTLAQSVPKSIRFWIGGGAGGGLDLYGRAIGPFIERALPGGPTITMQNLGGNGQQAIQAMNTSAPKDGSVFASVPPGPIQEPMMGAGVATYDLRDFRWIGAPARQAQVCFVLATSPVRTLEDASRRDVTLAVTSPLGSQAALANLVNAMLGTKLKPIPGYAGGGEVMLAIERGEVDGTCSSTSQLRTSRPQWVEERKLRVLIATSESDDPDFPGAPKLSSLLKSDADRQSLKFFQSTDSVLYPMFLPPATPEPIVAAYRAAFKAAAASPEYRAQAARAGQIVSPIEGADIEAVMKGMYATPPEIVARVRAVTQGRAEAR